MESAFATPTKKVLANFNVNDHDGLTDKQVAEFRSKHGRNCMLLLTRPRLVSAACTDHHSDPRGPAHPSVGAHP